MRIFLKPEFWLIAAVLVMPAIDACATDLHWLWDDRCAECHGHAGDFARKFLSVSGGELRGPHHKHDLRRFLHNHYLAGNEVDAVYTMLLAQANSPTRFRDECSSCHGAAADFVRDRLELRKGMLYSRASGHPVQGFLEHHRNLQPDDVDFFMQLLTRVAREVYRP
jgi:hypothetical protein